MGMRKNTYPDWVEKFRQKNREIKFIKGNYYLYERKTVYDKEKKRARKISGTYLGKITEDGLVKTAKRSAALPVEVGYPVEYGATELLELLGEDILANLKEYYRDELAELIFVIGKIGVIEPSPFKRMALIYSNSFDSVIHPGMKISKNDITAVLRELGENRAAQIGFMKKYVDNSETIIFDGSRLISYSDKMEMNRYGYNNYGIEDPQINLLYFFTLNPLKAPVYFKSNYGDKVDGSVIRDALRESGIQDATMIADKGFGSEENFVLFKENEIDYIIPLKRDDSLIDYSAIQNQSIRAFEGSFSFNGRAIFYLTQQEIKIRKLRGRPKSGRRNYVIEKDLIITYMDQTMKSKEISDYQSRLSEGRKAYSFEDLTAKEPAMGTLTLRCSKALTPEELYCTYKEREIIEDANKAYKHVLDNTAFWMQDDKAYDGWLFLNHISLMLYYRLFNPIKQQGLVSRYSVEDVIAMMKRVKMQRVNNRWNLLTGTEVEHQKLKQMYPEEVRQIMEVLPL